MLINGRNVRASFTTSLPSTQAEPELGANRVVKILISVVLPAPFGPSRPKSSPSLISRVTPSRAIRSPFGSSFFFRERYVRVRFSVRIADAVPINRIIGAKTERMDWRFPELPREERGAVIDVSLRIDPSLFLGTSRQYLLHALCGQLD